MLFYTIRCEIECAVSSRNEFYKSTNLQEWYSLISTRKIYPNSGSNINTFRTHSQTAILYPKEPSRNCTLESFMQKGALLGYHKKVEMSEIRFAGVRYSSRYSRAEISRWTELLVSAPAPTAFQGASPHPATCLAGPRESVQVRRQVWNGHRPSRSLSGLQKHSIVLSIRGSFVDKHVLEYAIIFS